MSREEINDTTAADPLCGFTLGSAEFRARPDHARLPRKHLCESPMVREG
jgi:hypothetical protein